MLSALDFERQIRLKGAWIYILVCLVSTISMCKIFQSIM